MDIAKLVLAVDSRSATTAAASMDRMTAAGRKAETQLGGVGGKAADAARGVNTIERSSTLAASAVSRLGSVLAIGFGTRAIIGQADAWTGLNNRLRLVTDTQAQLVRGQRAVFDISQLTSQALAGTGTVYQRFAANADELGISLGKVAELTETVSKAVAISGGSQAGNDAALMQFGQALASGVLRGEEFNSVMEQTPALIDALARGMGVSRGAMKALAEEGKITAAVMVDALTKARDSVDEKFATRVKTVAQSYQELENAVQKWIGTANDSAGVTTILSGAIGLVANNLDALATGAAVVGIGKLAVAIKGKAAAALESAAADRVAGAAALAKLQTDQAQAAATAAQTAVQVASTRATIADLASTEAAIVADRALVVAKIAATDAEMVRTRATIAATTANGANSYSIKLLASSEIALAQAQAARAGLVTQLAALGTAQAGVAARQTAATVALTAATTAHAAATGVATTAQGALTAATGAGALAARAGSAALGLLGGPIGAVATALTLGVGAWQTWGRESSSENDKVADSTRRTTAEIISDLDKQIKKLAERDKARAAGNAVGASGTEAGDRVNELQKEMDDALAGRGKYANNNPAQRQAIAAALGVQMGTLYGAQTKLNDATERANKLSKAQLEADWLGKYGTNADKLNAKLEETRKAFGGVIPPAVEKILREQFKDPEDNFLDRFDSKAMQMEKALKRARELGGGTIAPDLELRIREEYKEKPQRAAQLDEGARLAKQMEERVALLGKETEAEKLASQIAAGTIKFKTDGERQRAELAARSIDAFNATKEATDRALASAKAYADFINKAQAPYSSESDDILTQFGQLGAARSEGWLNKDMFERQLKEVTTLANGGMDEVTQYSIQAARTITDSLGDGIYNAVTGKWEDMGTQFLQTLAKMASAAAAAKLGELAFGNFGNTNKIGGIVGAGINAAVNWFSPGNVNATADISGTGTSFSNPDGMSGSWLSGLLGRAVGGPVGPNTITPVNENGPELVTAQGKTYLMNGGNNAWVTPLKGTQSVAGGGGSGGGAPVYQFTANFYGDGRKSENVRGQGNETAERFEQAIRVIAQDEFSRAHRQGGEGWKRQHETA